MFLRIFLFALLTTTAHSSTLHLTPEGAGTKDGSSWDNALDRSSLAAAVNELLQPGDTLLIGSGEYKEAALTIATGGKPGLAKTIKGVDRGEGLPVFAATWSVDAPSKGATALRIGSGVSHVTFKNLRLSGYTFGVYAKGGEPRTHLTFEDVDVRYSRHGFYLVDCDDLQFADCDLRRYTKHGFRFDQGCDRVVLRGCTADCSEGDAEWETKTELLPMGFTVNDGGAPNTALRFEDCAARNNMMPLQKNRYKNGDGFVVEGNSADVEFVRCRSLRNQDGGYDLKVRDVRLTDCIAIDNKRGFRIWTTGTLLNCFSGWSQTDLWCNGGPVTATRCTFYGSQAVAVMTDDRATQPITLEGCIVSVSSDSPKAKATSGKVILTETIVAAAGDPERDPRFRGAIQKWDGVGNSMDSQAFPGKGYSSARARGTEKH